MKKLGVFLGLGLLAAIALASNANAAPKAPKQPAEDEKEQELSRATSEKMIRTLEAAKKAGVQAPPGEVQSFIDQAIVNALVTGDADLIRDVAKRLAAIGYQYPASMLEAADQIEAEAKKKQQTKLDLKSVAQILNTIPPMKHPTGEIERPSRPPTAPAAPKVVQPKAVPPKVVPTPQKPAQAGGGMVDVGPKQPEPPITKPATAPPGQPRTPEFAAGQVEATKLAMHLQGVKKYAEDRAWVARWQASEGLKPDGLYGDKSAVEMIDYGIVPPAPFYWPTNWVKAKKDYQASLRAAAQRFPEKAGEFIAAANRIKL